MKVVVAVLVVVALVFVFGLGCRPSSGAASGQAVELPRWLESLVEDWLRPVPVKARDFRPVLPQDGTVLIEGSRSKSWSIAASDDGLRRVQLRWQSGAALKVTLDPRGAEEITAHGRLTSTDPEASFDLGESGGRLTLTRDGGGDRARMVFLDLVEKP